MVIRFKNVPCAVVFMSFVFIRRIVSHSRQQHGTLIAYTCMCNCFYMYKQLLLHV